jgi:hypothetical protein
LYPFGKLGFLVTAASKHRIQGSYSKYGTCMNTLYRNLGKFTAQNMMPWWGHLKFRMYNPRKITKYGVLLRMVSEAVSGYICNMAIY